MATDDFTIERLNHERTLWVIKELDLHRHEFGFWPTQAVYQAIDEGRIYGLNLNGEPASFLIRSPSQYQVKLYASFTVPDARLRDYCRALVTHFTKEAAEENAERLTLKTAEDLPANLVWHSLGLRQTRKLKPTGHSNRAMLQWELRFPRGQELDTWLEQQTADPKKKKILAAFGMEEQFRSAMTSRYRRNRK
jgi:hypothetical protein